MKGVDKFQVVGSRLMGPGLSFEVGLLDEDRKVLLVDIAGVIYHEGRARMQLPYDDRYKLHNAVETLRALAVIVGPFAGDRHRHAADIIAQLLQEQEGA